jgi:3-phenylpropionate/trans-cinnamate dioxygenase ferredoxin subunit
MTMLHYACLYDDLAKDFKMKIQIEGQSILLMLLLDKVYAIQDKCTHLGVSLSKGVVKNEHIQCRAHHARFNIKTGDVLDKAHIGFIKMPTKKLKTFKTEVTEGKIYIDL